MRKEFNNFVRRFGNVCYKGVGDGLTKYIKLKQLLFLPIYVFGALIFLNMAAGFQQTQKDRDIANAKLMGLDRKILETAELYDRQPGLSFTDQAELARVFGYKGVIKEGRSDVKLYHDESYGAIILNVDGKKQAISESAAKDYVDKKR